MENTYGFENIINDDSNRFAIAVARMLTKEGGTINPVMFYGLSGTGKTHVVCSVGKEFIQNNKSVIYTTAETVIEDIVNSKANISNIFNRNKYADLIIVEDCDCLYGKPQTQTEFSHLMMRFVKEGKQVVITTALKPHKLPTLSKLMFEDNNINCLRVSIEKPTITLKEIYALKTARELKISISKNMLDQLIMECDFLPEIHNKILEFKLPE